MQSVQNIPAPDGDAVDIEGDFDSHPDYPDVDKTEAENSDVNNIPVVPGEEPVYPIEEPRSEDIENPPVEEDINAPKRIV